MEADIVHFIQSALIKDPKDRPDIYALKKHKFFDGMNWDKVKRYEYESPILSYLINKFDINRIHDYYADKKPSKHTDFF